MDNKDEILSALENFNSKDDTITDIPDILEKVVRNIAQTGETVFSWPKLKQLIVMKVDVAMKTFEESASMDTLPPLPNVENVKFEGLRKRILDKLMEFTGAPFTIQRIAELVVEPNKFYKRTDKFLRGIEKNVMVVSTVDPFGNKIVSELKLLNGMDANGLSVDQDSSLFLPPAPMNSPMFTGSDAATSAADEGTPVPEWPQKQVDSASRPFNPIGPQPSTTSSLFSNTPVSSAEERSEPLTEDATSQGSEDSSQGSDKSDSSLSSLSSDDGPSQEHSKLEEAGLPSEQTELEISDISTGFEASHGNIEREPCNSEEEVSAHETTENKNENNASDDCKTIDSEQCEDSVQSEMETTPEEAIAKGESEDSTQKRESEDSIEKRESQSMSVDTVADKATEERMNEETAEPMDTDEIKEDAAKTDEIREDAAKTHDIREDAAKTDHIREDAAKTDDIREDASTRETPAEAGQGDTAEKFEADSEDTTPSRKKRKSEHLSSIDSPPSKRPVPDDSEQIIEPSLDSNRRESCGFETNPNCEEAESTTTTATTTHYDDTSSSNSDVTSTSESATSQPTNDVESSEAEVKTSIKKSVDTNNEMSENTESQSSVDTTEQPENSGNLENVSDMNVSVDSTSTADCKNSHPDSTETT